MMTKKRVIFISSLLIAVFICISVVTLNKYHKQNRRITELESAQAYTKKKFSKKENSFSSKKEVSKKSVSESTEQSTSAEMTASQAETLTMAYFNKFSKSITDGFQPRVKSSETRDLGDAFSVNIYDTPRHVIDFQVDKTTSAVTSGNLNYKQDASISSDVLDQKFHQKYADIVGKLNQQTGLNYHAGAQAVPQDPSLYALGTTSDYPVDFATSRSTGAGPSNLERDPIYTVNLTYNIDTGGFYISNLSSLPDFFSSF